MEMRRKDRQITHEEIVEALDNAEYGILSTINVDNSPYGTPVNFVYKDNAIYFHCANEGHRLNNIENNNNVSFTIVDSVELMAERFSTKYRSVIISGKAEVLIDEAEKRTALTALLEKLTPDFMESGLKYINASINDTTVVKINIDKMTGKANKG